MTGSYRPIRGPFGTLVVIAWRTRPLGIGATFWTNREQQECRLARSHGTETMKRS